MAKKYTGSLTLDWYNKQKAILLTDSTISTDIPAPTINWVNKDEALFYEINGSEGKGTRPYWVNREDIRVKEARPLTLQKTYKAIASDRPGTLQGTDPIYTIQESEQDDASIENILIKGDNLLALNSIKKMLSARHESGGIKCIYIDPPYNTGYGFEQYDDNLAHSEWLTLMRDRLNVLKDLLDDNGSIWISIDDEEVHYLKAICDETFGRGNFIANIVWEKRTTRENRRKFSFNHDHILLYAKNKEAFEAYRNHLPFTAEARARYSNPDNDPRGLWQSTPALAQAGHATASQFYELTNPGGIVLNPPPGNCWRYTKPRMLEEIANGNIFFTKGGNGVPRIKNFLKDNPGLTPETLWLANEVETNDLAKKHNVALVDEDIEVFETPKPEALIDRILSISTNPGDVVLDCFGGSGTTFSTATKLGRKWIGVEIGEHTDDIIISRLKKVLSGEDRGGISDAAKWNGGGSFKYYHLGPSIIEFNAKDEADFNWSLGKLFLEESFLSSYDYTLVADTSFLSSDLFANKDTLPKIGVQQVGSKTRVAIVSLNAPDGPQPTISFDELRDLYAALKVKFAPQYINVFTNRGVELAYDSKPDDLEVFKIPHAIFAELEK